MLEIILTVVAWRKGWSWRALLPAACAWTLMFLVLAGSGGGEGALGFIVVIALGELIALGIMAANKPAGEPDAAMQSLQLHYADECRNTGATGAAVAGMGR